MEKANVEAFLQNCKDAGIESWMLRFEGGNRSAVHGNEGCRIRLRDDDLIIIEPTRNYATRDGQFNVTSVAYDMIDNIRVLDLTFVQTIALLKNLGIYDDEMVELIQNSTKRSPFYVEKDKSNAGLAVLKDADGNDVIPPGSSGYITD